MMYVDRFWVGVFATIMFEILVVALFIAVNVRKVTVIDERRKPKDEQSKDNFD